MTLFNDFPLTFQFGTLDENLLYVGTYNPLWILASVSIAILASYAALNASIRTQHQQNTLSKRIWVVISAFTLGVGIWAMHFIGMLALKLPCHVKYDFLTTLISIIPSILVSGIALGVVSYGAKHLPLWLSSVLLGAGVGTMHYTGMAAMRFEGEIHYDPTLFGVSILVAVILSFIALWIKEQASILKKYHNFWVASIMGLAVSGMHYTAIFATYFVKKPAVIVWEASVLTPNTLALLVTVMTLFIALISLTLAIFSRNKDITAHLHKSHSQTLLLLNSMAEGAYGVDMSGYCQFVNDSFLKLLGYDYADEVIGKHIHTLIHHSHPDGSPYPAAECKMYSAYLQHKNIHICDEFFWRKDGSGIPVEYWSQPIVAKGVLVGAIATFIDITERKQAASEIERLAFYDPLTELPNRRLLQDRLKHALATSQRSGHKGALFFIDMDNFKTLNDTLGHDIGDLLLKEVAQRLKACVRACDTVARFGGDEFVVMLENLSKTELEAGEEAKTIGKKILSVLNESYQLATHDYLSTPSIGITLFHGDEIAIDELLKQADIAMYQAKSAGRNTLRFFNPDMQTVINHNALLEKNLNIALVKKQFRLYYQAQVHSEKGIVGAEVLIRWEHPEKGLIPPDDFIPFAEETGLILPIGQWVLETACAQIKQWEKNPEMVHLQLAVNVSAKQFFEVNFLNQVHDVVSRSGIKPNRLKLELTESLLLDNVAEVVIKMKALCALGICFSMDDFGTGYSSLSYLTKLPLNQLKIDQAFIRNIGVKSSDAIIIQTIIGMARNLGMDVIAEGVETEAQRDFLNQYDCSVYQGYLFSKPIPLDEFELLMLPIENRVVANS